MHVQLVCKLILPLPVAAPAAAAAEEDEEQEEEEETGVVDESLACEECGSRARGHEMLLCDNCDAAYHMGCLDPPVAGEGWSMHGAGSLYEMVHVFLR